MPFFVPKSLSSAQTRTVQELLDAYHDDAWACNYIAVHATRCAADVDAIASLGAVSSLVNIGGAPYLFEAMAKAAGYEVSSVDIDPERYAEVASRIDLTVHAFDIEQRSLADLAALKTADVVFLCEIFEHLRVDLIATLENLVHNLPEHCLIYVTTPNHFFLRKYVHWFRQGRSGPSLVKEWQKLHTIGHMGHVREYSRLELTELFESVGLSVKSYKARNRTASINLNPRYFLQTFLFTLLERLFDRFAEEHVFVLEVLSRQTQRPPES